ncbi:MAG TPA: ornithine carbamoyltransferase [Candidatus Fermentibacter daniensis]|jgi:ornithine carbamoyltransferase|nr:MAG: ornithine carbamoyltransferase [Candidatus Fermentibacter daniensis]MBP7719290.1 ornithine carbamoyltransferase [Candidatus Fermentibacter sp.]OQC69467.1 MAG: Ornithine carbamoyltransferase [candidate division Hyd24-12 bacterium ADurb.Bin004]KZD15362.1 MAG: ornithine carbamoyltransferase [Candidatus Fermentibacter daniensis]KZD18807.1 MAG: ornithine carbamoyltransferase [Candidatus Fermentibacter daniensis]
MGVNLRGRSLLTLLDYEPEEVRYLLDVSHSVKAERMTGNRHQRFHGMTLAMLFEKRSTRTRCAFETAFGEEGGHPVFLSNADIQLGAKESVEDTARVLGRMFDAIMFRGFSQETVEMLADYSGVPVYNGLTDMFHPTQVLADLMTIEERLGDVRGLEFVYAGDGRNNMANSLMIGSALMGMNCTILAPEGLHPDEELLKTVRSIAEDSGCEVNVTSNREEAIPGADVIYTDVWASMGEEDKLKDRIAQLEPYRVDDDMLAQTDNPDVIFMHCLPAVKGNEVTFEVIEGPHSVVWDEAENRKHTIKAVMIATLL